MPSAVTPATSLGSRRTTSSAIARALVRCEMSSTVAPSSASVARMPRHSRASVSGSSAELGSSSAITRRAAAQVAVERAGDGDALRLPAGEAGALHAELLRRVEVAGARERRARARTSGASGAASPRATLSAIVPAMSPGCWPAHASHVEGARSRTSRRRRGRRALERGGAAQGGEHARLAGAARSLEEGDGARAARPGRRAASIARRRGCTRRPSSDAAMRGRRALATACSSRSARRLDDRGRGARARARHPARRRRRRSPRRPRRRRGTARRPAAAADTPRAPAAARTGRPPSASDPSMQPEPDRHGDDRDRDAREELEREARQERHPQHPHRLAAVVVGDLLDGCRGPVLAPEHLERRQPLHGVGEARREALQRLPLALLHGARREADQHHEDRDEGDREQHREARDPVLPPHHERRSGASR